MKKNNGNSIIFNLLLITIFFNIWFPKAGIKIAGIPLTVGNILFAITFMVWCFLKIKNKTIKINQSFRLILVGIYYFIFKYFLVFCLGYKLSEVIGYVIPLVIYPLIFPIVYEVVDSEEKMNKLIKVIISGFFFLCFYALLQYFVGIDKCDIPGLTVNLTDYKEMGSLWFMAKSNGTDISSTKIVSTYQNGNLFGISMILIYPIVYNYYKYKNENKKLILSLVIFIGCVFLTLSRACWLGIILFILFEIIMQKSNNVKSIFKKITLIFICIVGIMIAFKYMPSIANRFLDTNLEDWISMSGRTEGMIEVFRTVYDSNSILAYIIGAFGIVNYSGLAYEMLPISMFVQTGIIGLLLLYGVFIKFIFDMKTDNYISKSVRLALIIWLIVGIIECGYWLPPAALNLFMLMALGYASKKIEFKKEEVK